MLLWLVDCSSTFFALVILLVVPVPDDMSVARAATVANGKTRGVLPLSHSDIEENTRRHEIHLWKSAKNLGMCAVWSTKDSWLCLMLAYVS